MISLLAVDPDGISAGNGKLGHGEPFRQGRINLDAVGGDRDGQRGADSEGCEGQSLTIQYQSLLGQENTGWRKSIGLRCGSWLGR